jgi:hypothetical protein
MLIRSPQSDDIHVNVLDTNKNNKAGTSAVSGLPWVLSFVTGDLTSHLCSAPYVFSIEYAEFSLF